MELSINESNIKNVFQENIINSYSNEIILFNGLDLINDKKHRKRLKKEKNLTFLYSEDVFSKEVEVPITLTLDDIYEVVIEEFRPLLDTSEKDTLRDYDFSFYKKDSVLTDSSFDFDGEENIDEDIKILAFAIEKKESEKKFNSLLKNAKYLDFVVPISVIFQYFYKINFESLKNSDIFVFIDKYQTTLYVFMNGSEVKNINIDFSLLEFSALFLEKIDQKDKDYNYFVKQITDFENPEVTLNFKKTVTEIYFELFKKLETEIEELKTKRVLIEIDRIFFVSYVGSLKGIEEFSETYFAVPSYNRLFLNEKFPLMLHGANQFQTILSNFYNDFGSQKYSSFSIFKKPKPIFQRESGKFLIVVSSLLLISFLAPLSDILIAEKNKSEIENLKIENRKLEKKYLETQKRLDSLIARKDKLESQLETSTLSLDSYLQLLEKIDKKKNLYYIKSEIIYEISEFVIKNNVLITEIKYVETPVKIKESNLNLTKKEFNFRLKSEKEQYLTTLFYELTKSFQHNISSEKIFLDKNLNLYFTDLKVILN